MRQLICGLISAITLVACSGGEGSPPLIHGVNFVGMSVTDLSQREAFFRESVDLQSVSLPASGLASVVAPLASEGGALSGELLLRSSNAQLRLMQFQGGEGTHLPAPVPVNGPGIAHVCFQVNRSTGAYERFLEAGARTIGAPEMVRISQSKPVDYAYIHGPDGAVIEVEHVDVEALDLEQPPANDYRIRHVSLATPDMGRALAFYSRLLGEPKPRHAGRFFKLSGDALDKISGFDQARIEMAWFQVRNLELELIEYHHPAPKALDAPRPVNAPGYNMIVFDVEDIPAVRERLLEAGGTVVSAEVKLDGGDVFFGRDPDGNLLGFQATTAATAVSSRQFKNNGL